MAEVSNLRLEDAAAELGVHYQTAYRWVRSGRLPAVMVNGRYRVDPEDVAAVRASREAPARPPAPTQQRLDRQRQAMRTALFEGDETKANAIVRTLRTNGTPVSRLIEEVLAPPLVEIGAAWKRGAVTIYVEHRASGIAGRLLAGLTPNPRGRRRGVAVVAALSGDLHQLPTAMATAALRDDHWTVEHLGADMPLAEVERFIGDHPVDLVVLSATGTGAVERAERARVELEEEHGVAVLTGGRGATIAGLQQLARRAVDD